MRPLGAGPAHAGEQGDEPRLQPHPGQRVGSGFFPAGDLPQADQLLAPRINGDFTGTTSEILRWAACKWGINQNIVFAQAAVESWWHQTTLGDWGTDAAACPPGHGPGADGKPGQCPQSYGILQNRYPFEQASWPGIADSTAMNADTAYAIWRSCYDGYETWLNNVPHGGTVPGRRRLGLRRALVRRALAHRPGPAVHRQGQAVPGRADLDHARLPAARVIGSGPGRRDL